MLSANHNEVFFLSYNKWKNSPMLIINVKVMVDKSVDDENDEICSAAHPSLLFVTTYNWRQQYFMDENLTNPCNRP